LLYFFGGLFNLKADSIFLTKIDEFLSFPSLFIFAYAYGGGNDYLFLIGFVVFLAIWIILIIMGYIISWILKIKTIKPI